MEPSVLNRDLLADNVCYGCGLENPDGLRIEVRPDANDATLLTGRFMPAGRMAGFPGITHGGLLYSAMDCMSTWVATLLGPNRGAAWLLRSARATYHKPAPTDQPVTLLGRVSEHGGAWDPLVVRVEALRADGSLCVEGEFKVVPLSLERFREVAGLERVPANWAAFLSTGA